VENRDESLQKINIK
jgi:hypothetical protein